MKKHILLFAIILPLSVNAQIAKGTVFLGGTLSSATTNYSNNGGNSNSFSISPQLGFITSERIAFGGSLGFSTYTNGVGRTNNFSIAAFNRVYFPIVPSFYFILHNQVGTGFGKTNNPSGNPDVNQFSFAISCSPKFIFFPSPHWGIEAGLGSVGVSTVQTKVDGDAPSKSTATSFTLSAGQISLGVAYYFFK